MLCTVQSAYAGKECYDSISQGLNPVAPTEGILDFSPIEKLLRKWAKSRGTGVEGITFFPCSEESKASAYQNFVFYNPNWVRGITGGDRDEVLAVFAHELGHHLDGHHSYNRELDPLEKEIRADRVAGCAAAEMGLPIDGVIKVLERIRHSGFSVIYPSEKNAKAIATEGYVGCGGGSSTSHPLILFGEDQFYNLTNTGSISIVNNAEDVGHAKHIKETIPLEERTKNYLLPDTSQVYFVVNTKSKDLGLTDIASYVLIRIVHVLDADATVYLDRLTIDREGAWLDGENRTLGEFPSYRKRDPNLDYFLQLHLGNSQDRVDNFTRTEPLYGYPKGGENHSWESRGFVGRSLEVYPECKSEEFICTLTQFIYRIKLSEEPSITNRLVFGRQISNAKKMYVAVNSPLEEFRKQYEIVVRE